MSQRAVAAGLAPPRSRLRRRMKWATCSRMGAPNQGGTREREISVLVLVNEVLAAVHERGE